MSKFSDQEKAAILRRSRELLSDDKPPVTPPAPAPRELPIPEPDPVAEWREWHDARAAEREANRAAMRRDARENARVLLALERIAALEQRIAELEASVATSDETLRQLAAGAEAFSSAVEAGLGRMEQRLVELSGKLVELRALDDVRRGEVLDLPANFIRKVHGSGPLN